MTLAAQRRTSWALKTEEGPAWLAKHRSGAATQFVERELPTERDENFRYGRIDDLDLDRFEPVGDTTPAAANSDPAGVALLGHIEHPLAVIRTSDGGRPSIEFSDGAAPNGLSITRLSEAREAPLGFGDLLSEVDEPFGLLADALAGDGLVIVVDRGVALDRPVLVIHEFTDGAAGGAVAPWTLVRLAEGAEASVIECFVSRSALLLVLPVTELHVAQGAHLAYHSVQQLGPRAWSLAYQLSRVARDGTLRSFSAALGGEYARLYTRSSLVGEGAESRMLATYLAKDSQVQDLRTFQEHAVGRTRSDLVFKGAVADRARSVYTGLIHIEKGARRANAAQTNRNIVLSEGAHADSVPNLDIEENDVRCSHASSVGPIDAEQRFYLESRGLPKDVAERLILLGFFDDLFDDVPDRSCGRYLAGLFAREIVAIRS